MNILCKVKKINNNLVAIFPDYFVKKENIKENQEIIITKMKILNFSS